jgi:3-oxoacyl-[acyl-carrier protein] reductase
MSPSPTATEGLAAVGVDDAAAKSIGAGLPMGRIGRPDDIAQAPRSSPPTARPG